MIVDDAHDRVLRGIDSLVVITPDERRAARLRERCRAQMRGAPTPRSRIGAVLVAGLCMIYLCALVLDLLRLRDIL